MAARAEQIGEKKANSEAVKTIVLAALAGAFVALGAIFSTTVLAGTERALPFGVTRLLFGLVFSVGPILVLVGGAELFTGNNLIVMAWAGGKVTTAQLLKNWLLVYLGNFVGALGTAGLAFVGGIYAFGGGAVGLAAMTIAHAKVSLSFEQAVALGILCNILVCLAVWLTFSARTTVDRILAIVPPIAAFMAAGFEQSVANMYFITAGLLIKTWAPPAFWESIGRSAGDYAGLTLDTFLLGNLLPVTLGNVIGGAGLVGVVYWFVYLRPANGRDG